MFLLASILLILLLMLSPAFAGKLPTGMFQTRNYRCIIDNEVRDVGTFS